MMSLPAETPEAALAPENTAAAISAPLYLWAPWGHRIGLLEWLVESDLD